MTRASERKASSELKAPRKRKASSELKAPRKRKAQTSREQTSRERLAVQALLELSQSATRDQSVQSDQSDQSDQSLPTFHRALSHQHTAALRANALFPSTQPGDTILMNFFIDANDYVTLQYMKNEAGQPYVHRMEGPLADIHTQWTYHVTDFPLK